MNVESKRILWERAVLIIAKGGGNIGRITIEFNEQDKEFVDRLMCAVEHSPVPNELWLGSECCSFQNLKSILAVEKSTVTV